MSYTFFKIYNMYTTYIYLLVFGCIWWWFMHWFMPQICFFFYLPDGLDGPTLWAVRLGKDSQTFGSTQLCRGEFGFVGWEGLMKVAVGMSWGFQGLGHLKNLKRCFQDFADSFVLNDSGNHEMGWSGTLRDLESASQSWLLSKKTSTPQWKDSYVLSSYELVWSFDLIGTWIATLQMWCRFPYSETLWNQAHLYPKPSAKNGSVEDLEQRLEMFLLVSQSLIRFFWYLLITWIYLPTQ